MIANADLVEMKKETDKRTVPIPSKLSGVLAGKRHYWYKMYSEECVLCGRGSEWRERVYGEKPDDFNKTHTFRQYACESHF